MSENLSGNRPSTARPSEPVVWCPCWGEVEPTGPWLYPDDAHADTHDVLLPDVRAAAQNGSSTPSDSSVTRSEVSTNLSTNDPSQAQS